MFKIKNKKLTNQNIFLLGIVYTIFTVFIWIQFINASMAYFEPLLTKPVAIVTSHKPHTAIVEVETILEVAQYSSDMKVEDKIAFYADIYQVNLEDALRIAKCESNFDASAENVNGSATGVYQIIRKTWKTYGGGNVYNADHNIIVFMQQYPKHPDWWECK